MSDKDDSVDRDEPGSCGGVHSGTLHGRAEFLCVSNLHNTSPAPLIQPSKQVGTFRSAERDETGACGGTLSGTAAQIATFLDLAPEKS